VEAIMLSSVKGTLNKYAVFSGKANRSEYWTFYLFCSFVLIVSGFLGALLGNESISNILFSTSLRLEFRDSDGIIPATFGIIL
jgi:uncharacterized membrane protein YhaH (DUF805 family)